MGLSCIILSQTQEDLICISVLSHVPCQQITRENWMELRPWIGLRLVEGMSPGEETAVFWHAPQFTGL